MSGDEERFRQNPFFILYEQPHSPLKHAGHSLDKLIYCTEKGIPVLYGAYSLHRRRQPCDPRGKFRPQYGRVPHRSRSRSAGEKGCDPRVRRWTDRFGHENDRVFVQRSRDDAQSFRSQGTGRASRDSGLQRWRVQRFATARSAGYSRMRLISHIRRYCGRKFRSTTSDIWHRG